jgi:hypothetical protein
MGRGIHPTPKEPAMAKSAARLNKATSLAELEARIGVGQRLLECPTADVYELAVAAVSRMEWEAEVRVLLPRLAKGFEAAADFQRASAPGSFELEPPLAEEAAAFRQGVRAQLDSLERTRERIRQIGTKVLNS